MRSAQRANHPRHAHTLPRAIAGLILEGRIVWQPRHRSPRGSRPDGRSYAPREEVEPKRQMTTRGYEHQRRPQAREGQSKAVWPTNWAYTPVTIRGGLCLEEQPARLRREEELLTKPFGPRRPWPRGCGGLGTVYRGEADLTVGLKPQEGGESLDTDVDPRVRASRRTPGPEGPYEGREADELDLCSRDHTGGSSLRTKGSLVPVRA